MAILKDNMLSGLAGNLVAYNWKGKQVIRTRPKKVKQTTATKARSKNFGQASKLAASFIYPFNELLYLKDRNNMRARLAGAISRFMGTTPLKDLSPAASIPVLEDFRMNPEAEFNSHSKRLFSIKAEPGQDLVLTLPEFVPASVFVSPYKSKSVDCTIVALSCELKDRWEYRKATLSISIPLVNKTVPAQESILSLQSRTGDLLLVAVSLLFRDGSGDGMEQDKFRPADIVAAKYF